MDKKLNEKLIAAIENKVTLGKISCKAALTIANQFEIPPKTVGDMCNKLKVKITACQLSCFGN